MSDERAAMSRAIRLLAQEIEARVLLLPTTDDYARAFRRGLMHGALIGVALIGGALWMSA